MIEMVPFKAEHYVDLLGKQSEELSSLIRMDYIRDLERDKYVYSLAKNGEVIVCGGVKEIWPDRGEAWAIFRGECASDFWQIHGHAKRFLDVCPIKRIEATVVLDFEQGHRWVKLLGFELEAPRMKAYRPDGADHALYARVR